MYEEGGTEGEIEVVSERGGGGREGASNGRER